MNYSRQIDASTHDVTTTTNLQALTILPRDSVVATDNKSNNIPNYGYLTKVYIPKFISRDKEFIKSILNLFALWFQLFL